MYGLTLSFFLLFISSPSFAHAGHDHADPMASLIHLVWIAPTLVGAFLLIQSLVKRRSSFDIKQNNK